MMLGIGYFYRWKAKTDNAGMILVFSGRTCHKVNIFSHIVANNIYHDYHIALFRIILYVYIFTALHCLV